MWGHVVIKNVCKCVWSWRTIWVSWLLNLSPYLYVFLHLLHMVLAVPDGTYLLFSGAWDDFNPLANLAKTPLSISQLCYRTQPLRPRKGAGPPSGFYPTSIPWCAFWPHFFFSPSVACNSSWKVSRTKPPGLCTGGGRCVLADKGQVGQKCVWLAWY